MSNIITDERSITDIVIAAMAGAENERLRQIAEAFVRHMHAFAREVRLTEEEFDLGIEFLNRIGQASHDLHNEAILFSDAIGFSTLVCLLNNGQNGATETASALLGPFWRMNSPPDRERRLHRPLPDARAGPLRRLPRHRSHRASRWRVSRSTSGRPRPSGSTRTRTPTSAR